MSDTAVQQSAASESVAEGSLLDQVMANSRMAPADEGYDVARKGVATFIANLLKSDEKGQPVNKALVDQMVVELDRKISAQMDEILHAPKLQELESSWRGLKLMVDRTEFRENIKVDILHATKQELLEDFEFAPDVTQTGFYKHIYAAEYGQFGGEPVGAIVGNYAFSPSTPDMKLLSTCRPWVPCPTRRSCPRWRRRSLASTAIRNCRRSRSSVPSSKARNTPSGAPCANRKTPVTWA